MSEIERAAGLIRDADTLVVTAGAGMGVDSGLPDFRGDYGFWRAYPALGRLGRSFAEVASPATFASDPALAWGFYGHRLNLYRRTVPHEGFAILKRWAATKPAFVFTSNVDGQFARAGFDVDRMVECHGSIHHLQCAAACTDAIWPADDFAPDVDDAACRLRNDPPRCPHCGGLARPNILMFGDGAWVGDRTDAQYARYRDWRRDAGRAVVIEFGAGTAVPSVRRFGESQRAALIRVNPREPSLDGRSGVSIESGALDAIRAIDAFLSP